MENELTSCILHYLLDHYFESKADMARKLDVNKRVLQRILNNAEQTKGGTIALDRALCFCALHGISLDPILSEFSQQSGHNQEKEAHEKLEVEAKPAVEAAYTHLYLHMSEKLTPQGVEVFHSMLRFIQQASAHICPNCATWCNPWDGTAKLAGGTCYLARMARNICHDVAELYSSEGKK